MKKLAYVVLVLSSFASSVFAYEYKLEGSMRARGEDVLNFDARWDPKIGSRGRIDWADMRLRVEPSIKFDDELLFWSQVDLFETFSGAPASEKHPGWESDKLYTGGVETFFPNYFYLEYKPANLGNLKVGSIPFNWGYGMWHNDANSDDAERMVLRIPRGHISGFVYDYKFGDFTPGVLYSEIVEGSIFERKGVDFDDRLRGGLFLKYNKDNFIDSGIQYQREIYLKSKEYDIDLYAKLLGDFHTGIEFAYNGGADNTGMGIKKYGLYHNIGYDYDKYKFNFDTVFASGDKDSTKETNETFSFSGDFQYSMILFKTLYGKNYYDDSMYTPSVGVKKDGLHPYAIADAFAIKPSIETVVIAEKVSVGAAVIAAWRHRDIAGNENKKLGTEIDFWGKLKLHKNLSVSAGGAVLFPGKALLKVDEYETLKAKPLAGNFTLLLKF